MKEVREILYKVKINKVIGDTSILIENIVSDSRKVKQKDLYAAIDGVNVDSSLRDTLLSDKVETKEEALIEIYRRLRPGDPPSVEQAEQLLQSLFL